MATSEATARDGLAALLDFYLEAGVDTVLEEEAVDRFAETERAASAIAAPRRSSAPDTSRQSASVLSRNSPPPQALSRRASTQATPATPGRPQAPVGASGDQAAMAARDAAAGAETLDQLRETLAGFEGCTLRFTAKNLVFADGNPNARLMFVGEAPGRDEDIQGVPFVGRSGRLLDRMLAAIGLDRSSAYIANVVPWRPPGNRTPSPVETEICRPFIERQIALVDPDILVFLGGASAKQLLGTSQGILRLRGKWHAYAGAGREIRAIPTLHPAYLLRNPAEKRLAWRDFLAIRAAFDEGG